MPHGSFASTRDATRAAGPAVPDTRLAKTHAPPPGSANPPSRRQS